MTFRDGLALLTLLSVAACAGPNSGPAPQAERFASLAFAADPDAASAAVPPAAAEPNGYLIEVAFERADGGRLVPPPLTAPAGQTVGFALVQPSPYQPDVDGDSNAPVVPPLEDGIRMQVCAQRAGDGGVVLAYRLRMARVTGPSKEETSGGKTVRVTQQDLAEVSGTRWLEPGVRGALARVPGPDGSGQLLVLARATPQKVERPLDEGVFSPAAPKADLEPVIDLSRPMTGNTMHLRVSAVRTARGFPSGAVIDETATSDVLNAAGGEILRDFEAYTCLDSRVRFTGTSGAASFDATLGDDGRVTITWNGRKASVRANNGRRFVAVAPVEGGGTAGVIVSVNADD